MPNGWEGQSPEEEEEERGDDIRADISGDVSGQVAVGKDIHQEQTVGGGAGEVTEEELQELRGQIEALKEQVKAEAPQEKVDAAVERLDELEKAVVEKEEPDLTTMEYVRKWFGEHLPQFAGAVTSVVVHPIVGRLVEAAGDAAVSEFKRRFGS